MWTELLVVVVLAAAWVIFGLIRAEPSSCEAPDGCDHCADAGKCGDHFQIRKRP